MPNIFDGINKIDNNELCYQIAMLEEVTMTNVFKQMGQQVSNKAVSAFRAIRKSVTGKETKVPKVIRIEELIQNKKEELTSLNREELDMRIRGVLTDKINSATSVL